LVSTTWCHARRAGLGPEAFVIERLETISAPTRQLSGYIAEALSRPLPEAVVEKTRHHILDTLAAMVSGSRLRPGEMAIGYIGSFGGAPEASVIGTALLTPSVNAALANGMLAHADETDDSHAPSRTHPGCAVIPAALAVAERTHASGEDFLRAVVLGYDVCARVNYALGPDALAAASRSTHSFGGVFGAGAAAGALLRFDALQVRHLLSYCAQQASGVGCNVRDGEHIEKAFDFGGMPARNGVAAATMVAHGFTGVDDVFSGERNFLEAFAPEPDPAQLADALGQRFEIMATNIKKWSVGSPAQSALDALTHVMEEAAPAIDDIVSVRVHLPTRSARTVDNAPMPDVNVQHLLALLLIDGALTFHSVHDQARMADPIVLAVRRRIELVPSQELMEARPRRQAIVEVSLRDGRRLMHRTRAVRGTADNPMTRSEVEAKALDLMAGVLGAERAQKLVEACRTIEYSRDMCALRQYWQHVSSAGRGV
jgi:2-methylcitrate dehydratase PrpD